MKQKRMAAFCLIVVIQLAGARALRAQSLDTSHSELRPLIERFVADRGALVRFHNVPNSPTRTAALKRFYDETQAQLAALNFDKLGYDGQIDYLLLKNHLAYEQRTLATNAAAFAESEKLMPFVSTIFDWHETRRKLAKLDPAQTAARMNELTKQIAAARKAIDPAAVKKPVANRAAQELNALRGTLREWFNYYNGYDPLFSWWVEAPYKQVDAALQSYAAFLRERIVGVKAPNGSEDTEAIIGYPIGREALMSDLAYEQIPYTPEELIEIGKKELAWCQNEMKKVAREMGFGDDWHAALEKVKNTYVEPGKQTEIIRDLALEAIDYVEKNDLVTVPQLAKDSWRMDMMSPERQLVSPFFLGGESILVSYPTNTMQHEAKLMSMRGNNPNFSRATVQHELIPGHHLQGFMTQRFKPYRQLFGTPFWGEGWALYWELLLWDRGFPVTPEQKMGMLFWRAHRGARIVFSLSFHLGQMSPQQCIDMLVNDVGHELDNATAEVRRSFAGSYGPLYQAAYLLGGLQFYGLQKELVGGGKLSNRAFHDWILRENRIPVALVRATLTQQKLTKDFQSGWRFYVPR
jgi:Bacterial protein of unknown function (DUF885)